MTVPKQAIPRVFLLWSVAGSLNLLAVCVCSCHAPSPERPALEPKRVVPSATADQASVVPSTSSSPADAAAPTATEPQLAVDSAKREPTAPPVELPTEPAPEQSRRTSRHEGPDCCPCRNGDPGCVNGRFCVPTRLMTGEDSGDPRPFDRCRAVVALNAVTRRVAACWNQTVPAGTARVAVVIAPDGKVTSAEVEGPPYAATPAARCIANVVMAAKFPRFDGKPVTVRKAYKLP